ncbi:uncharacterized protein L201_007130 [Kwoniella dendrophila CBS 6074]|uniref:Protein kinase domain-containing protein n=1 Tax=Kwoniella dendrophila CBS 6074 TaxID=1295534 RepID=A0AAX4K347_9TREE
MTGNLRPDTITHYDMMNDGYWSSFTSDFDHYELGPAIGFGASSTVYEAVFTLPSSIYPVITNSTTKSGNPVNESSRKPNLSITVPSAIENGHEKERICAIKVSTSHPDVELLGREIKMLSLCRHPNVLRILATFTLPPDNHRICLVTPFIPGGSLAGILSWRSRLNTTPKTHHFPSFRIGNRKRKDDDDDLDEDSNKGRLDEEEIKCVTKQVLEGLGYLHQNGFLHRDIKAGNLLIDEDGTILLADFGVGGDLNTPPSPGRTRKIRLAVDELRFNDTSTSNIPQNGYGPGKIDKNDSAFIGGDDLKKKKSFVGTPNWMAPEVIIGQKYDQSADIWSLGITLLELAHGSVPGAKYKTNKALSRIITDPSPTLDRSIGGYSKLMKEFVDLCLNKDPAARPSAQDLMGHHWLKGAKKHSFLAQTLLEDVPPLAQRQELRRVPTQSSLLSHTSSWDFSNTPNPSMPSSPIRNSLLIPSARSPSISSNLEYFNTVGRTHSRNSSFSLHGDGLPPSPRVSLKHWAEKTYDESSLSLRISNSERGKRRSLVGAGLRRGKSTNFDSRNQSPVPSNRDRDQINMSSSSLNKIDNLINSEIHSQQQPILGLMSPVMEVSKSKDKDGDIPELNGMTGLGISNTGLDTRQQHCVESGLSESPEDILDLGRPLEITPKISQRQKMSVNQNTDNIEDLVEGMEVGDHHRKKLENESQADSSAEFHQNGTSSFKIESQANTPIIREPNSSQETSSKTDERSAENEGSLTRTSPNNEKPPIQPKLDKEKEKKYWLGRRSSMKKSEVKPIISNLTTQSGLIEKVDGGHAMGKTNSWQGVLGRVTGKIRESLFGDPLILILSEESYI